MDIKYLTLIFFSMFSIFTFGQQPPEYLKFTFTDTNGKTILPELTVHENNINYNEEKESLYILSNTLKIDFTNELDGRFFQYNDSDNRLITTICSIIPEYYLGQEITLIAKYQDKIMQITFFGQSMRNFNCWDWSKVKIMFREGFFHYYNIDNVSNKSGFNSYQSSQYMINTIENLNIFEIQNIKTIKVKDYFGLNHKKELLPLSEILNSYENKKLTKYIGFVFKKGIPIGYGIVEGDFIRLIEIYPKAIKILKKYYVQSKDDYIKI